MSIQPETILDALAKSLREILEFRGLPAGPDVIIVPRTDPEKDLGLESDDLVLVATEIGDILKTDIPEGVIRWVDDSEGRRRLRTVGEIANDILNYLNSTRSASHG